MFVLVAETFFSMYIERNIEVKDYIKPEIEIIEYSIEEEITSILDGSQGTEDDEFGWDN